MVPCTRPSISGPRIRAVPYSGCDLCLGASSVRVTNGRTSLLELLPARARGQRPDRDNHRPVVSSQQGDRLRHECGLLTSVHGRTGSHDRAFTMTAAAGSPADPYPESNKAQLTYDSRGNITKAHANSGDARRYADLITTVDLSRQLHQRRRPAISRPLTDPRRQCDRLYPMTQSRRGADRHLPALTTGAVQPADPYTDYRLRLLQELRRISRFGQPIAIC